MLSHLDAVWGLYGLLDCLHCFGGRSDLAYTVVFLLLQCVEYGCSDNACGLVLPLLRSFTCAMCITMLLEDDMIYVAAALGSFHLWHTEGSPKGSLTM